MELRKRFPKFSTLLYLYPEPYRTHYSEQILQTLADMLDDASSRPQKAAIWSRTLLDLPYSAVRQQISYTGDIMVDQTPKYVKNSALIGAILLVPFFALIIAHSIDRGLQNSVFWHWGSLFTFFVVLPMLAFLLALVAFISWLIERKRTEKKSWLAELLDIHRNWHLLAVLIIGLGIVGMVYGHDSVHCVTGNPVHEANQWHQTLRCIEQR